MKSDTGIRARLMAGGRFGVIHLALTFLAAASTSFATSMLGLPAFLPRLIFVAGVLTLPLSFGYGYFNGRGNSEALHDDGEPVDVLERKLELLEQERDFYRDLVVDAKVPVQKRTGED